LGLDDHSLQTDDYGFMTEQQSKSDLERKQHEPDDRPYPVLSNRVIISAAVVLLLVGAGLAITLLVAFGSGHAAAQLDAIKTAGTIVVGTGGAAALWLAARRQRTTEIALNQKHVDQLAADRVFEFQQAAAEQNRVHLERVATATERDAAARRLNDLYLKAVEQLGSDKPVVRLGALFALERVGKEDPTQRQTVVDVVCSYLRSPFTLTTSTPRPLGGIRRPPARDRRSVLPAAPTSANAHHQEREVRVTAQRLLARVLRGADDHLDEDNRWQGMNLDLIGATLIDLDFTHCRMNIAWFEKATFIGEAWLNNTISRSSFAGARFTDRTYFDGAQFVDGVVFEDVTFDHVTFEKAKFDKYARFEDAVFLGDANFTGAKFSGDAWFDRTRFERRANFELARFERPPRALGVHFEYERPRSFET
jgi:uncharacterized protein YjbI with pentapeptide repeats